jgi:AAHS family benzoate transporter-like MFS transporter
MNELMINDVIDDARFRRFHMTIVALCGLLLIVDGYDVFIYGAVLPQLMEQWNLTAPQAGSLASWALFGMMIGALTFGSLGDRIGRKRCIAICFSIFSLSTIVNGLAGNTTEFAVLRFLAGLGCGGLMPNAVALTNEYAPKRLRTTLVALMFSGYAVGGMVAAGLGIWLLPAFGWRSMFFAAAVPLLLLPVILWKLPESLSVLIRRGDQAKARGLLARIAPERVIPNGQRLGYADAKGGSTSIAELFRRDRAVGTLALWVCFFCCLLMVYALGSWLPQLMRSAGYSLGSSLSFLLALNFGGMFGAIGGGRLADRFGLSRVVTAFFTLGAACIALLGINSATPVLYLLIFIAGAGTTGTQILLYATVADFYGASIRTTGLGWASGVGRVGAIVGPLLGGLLLAAKLPMTLNFVAFAIPGLVSVAAISVFGFRRRRLGGSITVPAAVNPA